MAAAVTLVAQTGAARDEEFARRQYDSGLSFLDKKQYAEALKDFQAIVEGLPKSSLADDALLQIATYHMDVAHDLGAAQTSNDKLLREYPDSDSAAMGHVLAGRIAIAKGRAQKDVDAALASFDRVPRLFPMSEAVAAAGVYAGDTLRLARRADESVRRLRQVEMEYPRSIWAARASLVAGLSLVQADRATSALQELQRVRELFPGSPEAGAALAENTLLYRLYVKAAAKRPAFSFSGRYIGSETAKYRDVVGIVVDDAGRTLLGHRQAISIFDAKGAVAKNVAAEEPSAFLYDERGRVIISQKGQLFVEGSNNPFTIVIPPPTPAAKGRIVEEIPAMTMLANGDRLVSDPKGKTVLRLAPDGKYVGVFASVTADRFAVSRLDDVAMIDKDAKAIAITDRDGKNLSKIPLKGADYELNNPIDLTFDQFGHLYVLDRGKPSVLIFGLKNKLLTTVTIPEKDPGSFQRPQALAVDAAGRLLIFDERSQRIQVYQ